MQESKMADKQEKQMTPEELMRIYPFLDELMASTLLKMSEQNKLESFFAEVAQAKPLSDLTLKGAIMVEEPKEKSLRAITNNGER